MLVRRIVHGKPFETIQFHRKQLMTQVVDWIGAFDSDRDDSFRHELIGLLAKDLKQNLKSVPTVDSEWTKLLKKWLKTSGGMDRRVYRILAVDGFRGLTPKDLKLYLPNVLSPLRREYESHVCGVRKLYDHFDTYSLSGTDSACIVFMALIDFYALRMQNDLMLDDQVRFRVQRAKSWAQLTLEQDVDYFRDVKNVDERLLKELGEIYAKEFQDAELVKTLGRELLTHLKC